MRKDKVHMKEKMSKAGYHQGNMEPHVVDYQRPQSVYSQTQPGKTTEYIERQNKHQTKQAKGIEKQAYQGRYS